VSEPEIRGSAEAGAYLRALREILLYAEVSDCSMEEGSLRVDANVSARPVGESAYRTRTEIKNLNSFSNVERALELEYARHVAVHEAGGTIVQQTMLFDAHKNEVRGARSKEGSHDYRYFPEPDLPPLVLSTAWIQGIRYGLPEFPAARRARYAKDLSLSETDAAVLAASRDLGDYFEKVVAVSGDAKMAANWMMSEVSASLNESGVDIRTFPLKPAALGELIVQVKNGALSNSAAKTVFATMLKEGGSAAEIAMRDGLLQVGDDSALIGWIDEVWMEHPDEAGRFAAGERKLQGVLVGFVMKKSKGRADPKKVNQLLGARAGT
jgi:aspartyl-tRNA(Asn)/glutamyl-tRNA(Gln) amidotransferase subunit B